MAALNADFLFPDADFFYSQMQIFYSQMQILFPDAIEELLKVII